MDRLEENACNIVSEAAAKWRIWSELPRSQYQLVSFASHAFRHKLDVTRIVLAVGVCGYDTNAVSAVYQGAINPGLQGCSFPQVDGVSNNRYLFKLRKGAENGLIFRPAPVIDQDNSVKAFPDQGFDERGEVLRRAVGWNDEADR